MSLRRRWLAIGAALLCLAAAEPAELTALETRLGSLDSPATAKAVARDADATARRFEKAGRAEPAARALRYAGVALLTAEDHAAALERFDMSAALCRAASDEACLGRALNNAAVPLQALDRMADALNRLRAASEAFRRAGEPELAGTARFNAANIQLALGDAAGALDAYDAIARDYPSGNFALGLETNRAAALLEVAKPQAAAAAARRALYLARDPAMREGYLADMRLVNLITLARADAAMGDTAEAWRVFAQARALAKGTDRDKFNLALGCLQLHAASGSLRDAASCAATVEALRTLEDEGTRAEALALAARAFAAAGAAGRGFSLMQASNELLSAQRRTALAQASATATADVGLAERNALVERIRREQAAERAAGERFRLAVAGGIGATLAAAVGAFLWWRGQQQRRRDTAIADDRLRVARDLHDTALQGFAAVTMELHGTALAAKRSGDDALAGRLDRLARDAGASLSLVRDAVWKMRSPEAFEGGLADAISAWLASRRDARPSITSQIDVPPDRLRPDQSEALLRVVQEAVANAANHGAAANVTVMASVSGDDVHLTVNDDGVGFVPTEAAALGGRWGLLGMRERMESLGGRLTVESAPGAGTRISATIPAPA